MNHTGAKPDAGSHAAAGRPGEARGFDRSRLHNTQINAETLLATDYLNHFNNVEMIIELLPGAPDYFDEIADWRPRGYVEHFADSPLRDAPLAIEAYRHVPAGVRSLFENIVGRLNEAAAASVAQARAAIRARDRQRLAATCAGAADELRGLIHEAGGIINGTTLRDVADIARFDAPTPAPRE